MKIAVDGVGARIAEGIGATALFFWVKQVAPGGVVTGLLDTSWMAWLTLGTVIIWLFITQKLRVQVQRERAATPTKPMSVSDIECERFPDQCPCTTELGKGIA